MSERLRRMRLLTSVMLDVELANLAKITAEDEALVREIHDVEQARAKSSGNISTPTGLDVATTGGALPRWENWCVQQSVKLNQNRAELRVKMESQRQKTNLVFGRAEAIKELVRRDVESVKRLRNRTK